MMRIDAFGAKIAGEKASESDDTKAKAPVDELEELRSRFPVLEKELKDLTDLNLSMFRSIVDPNAVSSDFFSAEFDKTDPKVDKCEAPRDWNLRAQGDFYVSWRICNSIYFVVGDATGHHAYAGGIKLFIATALKEMFDRSRRKLLRPEAAVVVKLLEKSFSRLAKFGSKKSGSGKGGANVVVLRIDCGPDRRITYASAGLPVYSLGRSSLKKYGRFGDGDGVRFPKVAARKPGAAGCVEDAPFLVIVTDGFRSLGRHRSKDKRSLGEAKTFGDDQVKKALLRPFTRKTGSKTKRRPTAQDITGALVAAAREFRRGHHIPECYDDDRLVVAVDLDAVWRQGLKGA